MNKELLYKDLYDNLKNKINIIIIEKDLNNKLVSIEKYKKEIYNNILSDIELKNEIEKIKSNNYKILYILNFFINKKIEELYDIDCNNSNNYILNLIKNIKNINFENKNYNENDSLIFIIEKKNTDYIKIYKNKNKTKKNKLK
tara:strand:+ start:2782 stop:3210 length:429 start_codon:yes stop_codon:yes gene_type:complete